MLIVTRRRGEVVVIGDGIRLTVLGVQGNAVKIGVLAPKDTKILREELFLRDQAARAA